MSKKVTWLLLLALGSAAQARDLAAIKASGTLIVATDPTYPPFLYTQGTKIVGFEAQLAEAVAARLGVKVQWKTAGFDTLLIGLSQNRYDMVVASHGITAERLKAVDFSNPDYCSGGLIVTKGGAPLKVDALKGKNVAVQLGTTYSSSVQKLSGLKSVKTYPTNNDALQVLLAGRVDAFVTDRFVAMEARKKFPNAKLQLGEMLFQEKIGMAFQKGNSGLVSAVNGVLSGMMNDGSYKTLSEKYFGEDIRCQGFTK